MKILLVDEDRASIERLSAALGAREGVVLITAGSAAEAFDAVAEEENLDVLVTAALMAPQDGFHLRSALRARYPRMRVAYTSRSDLSRHSEKVAGDIVFQKPVNTDALQGWLDGASAQELAEAQAVPVAQETESTREGTRIGDYELLKLISAPERTETYEAMQVSVQRRVAFTLLREEVRLSEPDAVESFLAEVRAKAGVVHQHIAPVYEAHEEDEALFYTRELIEGRTLEDMRKGNARLTPKVAVSLIRVVADSFEYLRARAIPFATLLPQHVYLGPDGQARLVNIAVAGGEADDRSESEQIRRFAEMVKPLAGLKEQTKEAEVVSRLIYMMGHEKDGEINGSWASLSKAAEVAVLELEKGSVSGLYDMERKALRASRKRKLVRVAFAAGCLVTIAAIAKGVWEIVSVFDRPAAKDFSEMVRIPPGRYLYQDESEARELEAFWIDEYEVTIAQYGAFLEALANSPSSGKELDHQDQPESKRGHVPPDWDEYYRAAKRGEFFKGQRVELNCPVTMVDWWDAYAYAKWKGRRLPTEEEWEKAARGRSGNLYPWGDEFVDSNLRPSRNDSGNPDDPHAGMDDGDDHWWPVDAVTGDVSSYDVKGMAGNVSEWTASWTSHPEYPDRQVPVKRGGSFATTTGYELHLRRPANSPEERSMTLGLRTATSVRPDEAVIDLD